MILLGGLLTAAKAFVNFIRCKRFAKLVDVCELRNTNRSCTVVRDLLVFLPTERTVVKQSLLVDCGDNREMHINWQTVMSRRCCGLWCVFCRSDHGVWPTDMCIVLVNMPLYTVCTCMCELSVLCWWQKLNDLHVLTWNYTVWNTVYRALMQLNSLAETTRTKNYTVGQKTAPFYVCSNYVEVYHSEVMVPIYSNKFRTKRNQNHRSF